jgi:hypothetical protein
MLGLAFAGAGELFAERAYAAAAGFNQPYASPPPGITSHYGYRIHPIYGDRRLHAGTDYGMAANRPIMAIAAGQVTDSWYGDGGGNMVEITHADGVWSVYMHMIAASPLAVGSLVKAGDVVGRVGSTGGSTAAHLHLGIKVNGSFVDPAAFLAGAPTAGQAPPPTPPPPLLGDPDTMAFAIVQSGTTGVDTYQWIAIYGAGVKNNWVEINPQDRGPWNVFKAVNDWQAGLGRGTVIPLATVDNLAWTNLKLIYSEA